MSEIIHFFITYPFFQFLGEAIICLLIAFVISWRMHTMRPFWVTLALWSLGGIAGTIIASLHMLGLLHY